MTSWIKRILGGHQQPISASIDAEPVAHEPPPASPKYDIKQEGAVAGQSNTDEAQSYDMLVEEITRTASQRLSSGESLHYFETREEALGFEMYQAAMGMLTQVLNRGDGSTALAVIEFLEAGHYPGLGDHARGLHTKGCALLLLGRNEEALECFDRCFHGHGTEVPEVLLNRASALSALKRYQEALSCIDQACEIGAIAAAAGRVKQRILAEIIASVPTGEEWQVAWIECGHWVKCHLTDPAADYRLAFGLERHGQIRKCPACRQPIKRIIMIPLMSSQPQDPGFDALRSAAFFAPFGVLCGAPDDVACVPARR